MLIEAKLNFEETLLTTLNEMFECKSIEYKENNEIKLNIDSKMVEIDLNKLSIKCDEDQNIEQIIGSLIKQTRDLKS
jgi:hypothetical protein